MRDAWNTPYAGNAAEILYRIIEGMKKNKWSRSADENRDYGNTAAIVQSSGAGKSRMVDEAARLVFTFPFNLRPDTASQCESQCYPQRDMIFDRDSSCLC